MIRTTTVAVASPGNSRENQLSDASRPRRAAGRRSRAARPVLEMLEGRSLLSTFLTYGGGPLLPHVQVESVFWGQAWSTNTQLQKNAQDLDTFLSWITTSPYMDMLSEYSVSQYSIGRGQFTDGKVLNNAPIASSIDDSQIQAVLNQDILQGSLDSPNANRLYFVYMPPNAVVTNGSMNSLDNFAGYHDAFRDSVGAWVYYAVIPHPEGGERPNNLGLTYFQQQTEPSSHELAEAVTDPQPPSGWYAQGQGEIGDLVNWQYDIYNYNGLGYVVQKEWSNAAQKGILPQETAHTSNWSFTGGYLRDITAGYAAVFGLAADNQLWVHYDGGGWTPTRGYGQEISLGLDWYGNQEVWLRGGDSSVWRYDQGQWFFTGGYLKSIDAGFGEVFGLAYNNQVWVYNDGASWIPTGGYVQSISVGLDLHRNDELWALAGNNGVWRYDQGQWLYTGGYLKSIDAGYAGEVFGLAYDNQVWVANDQMGWIPTHGYGNAMKVGTDGYALDELWLLAADNGVWRYDQGQWFFTGGYLNAIAAGYRQVFGFDGNNQIWSFSDDGGGWVATGGYGREISIGTDSAGHNELWLLAADTGVWRFGGTAQGASSSSITSSMGVSSNAQTSLASFGVLALPADTTALNDFWTHPLSAQDKIKTTRSGHS
jgi:hypothetical protein